MAGGEQGNGSEGGTCAIVTDATCDVPRIERDVGVGVPWTMLPEVWRTVRDEDVVDDGSPNATLSASMAASGLARRPEPSEPQWDDFVAAYRHLREIDRVFSIHGPSSSSWAVEHAREAAGAYPNVRVIEANATGIGVGLLATCARRLAAEGAGPDAVEAWLRAHRERVKMIVVPDRFDPTVSQRRLSTRLLTGQPVLHGGGEGGRLARSRGLRSRRATVAAIERYFLETTTDNAPLLLALGHGDAAGAVDPFLDVLERMRPRAHIELVGRVGPRLVGQLGAPCVAAAWLELLDDEEPRAGA